MISKEDFVQWRNQGVTQEQRAAMVEVVEAMGAEIINRTEPNPNRDQFVRGFIQGLVSVIEWTPEFHEEDNAQEEQ